ncbi:MAG: hypothetical protein QM765_17645 [Myxococcales bacterium]
MESSNTDITIYRDPASATPFAAVPRVFMNPSNATGTEPAIPLTATSFSNADTLTSVVPKGSLPNTYDLIVVNPDGAVGILANAFEVTELPPPVITSSTPASIVNAASQPITVAGTDFRGAVLSVDSCADATGTKLASPATLATTAASLSCTGSACTIQGVVNAATLPDGATCILKVTNDDGTWAIYSAIGVTGPSLNLSLPRAGKSMNTARRALVAAAGDATAAARFVYAIGGDTGAAAAATPLDSVESAPVDIFGNMGAWSDQRYKLPGPRAFAASAQLGRYTYLCGGTDGAAVLKSCVRAKILDPLETPALTVADLLVKETGLDAGYWFYRVSATFSGADPENPLGESLPSDEIVVKVPALLESRKVQVVLSWSAPVDSAGAPLPNVAGYRVYRSAAVNGTASSEVLVATVTGATQWTDDGSAVAGTETFLPLGSTGTWAALPDLGTARKGLGMTWGADPVTAGRFYVYALAGKTTATTTTASYEYLAIDVLPNGHHTVGASWTAGTNSISAGRWQIAAFRGDSTTATGIHGSDTYVWAGGGLDAADRDTTAGAKNFDAGKIAAGGDLGLFTVVNGFSSGFAGYGSCAANNQLFVFGGASASPSAKANSSEIGTPPALGNWNAGISMTESRYLLGSAVQSAYIFLVGGQTGSAAASKTTEVVIW